MMPRVMIPINVGRRANNCCRWLAAIKVAASASRQHQISDFNSSRGASVSELATSGRRLHFQADDEF
jgi:hypothetical protein